MADELTNIKNFPLAGAPSTAPRSMPHNLPAEQNLLGAILLDNSVIERIDDRLVDAHFYDPLNGRIFNPMQLLIARGQRANPVPINSFFANSAEAEDGDVGSYLTELADGVISITQAPDYAHTIYPAHSPRELLLIGDEVIFYARQPTIAAPATLQLEPAAANLLKITDTETPSTVHGRFYM